MNSIHFFTVLRELTPDDFGFDYAQRVTVPSMISMVFSIILAIAVPVLLFLYLKHRYKLEPYVALYSLLAYMLGGYLIPNILGIALQWVDFQTGIFTESETLYYILVSLLTVGLILAAIWIAMKFVRRRTKISLGLSVLFALCLCIIPLCTQTISYLGNYLSIAATVNNGGLRDIVAGMLEQEDTTREQVEGLLEAIGFLCSGEVLYYLMMALDVLLMIPIQAGVCAILGGILTNRIPRAHTKLVLLIEAVYAAALLLRNVGFTDSLVFAELLYLITAAVSLFVAYREAKQYMADDLSRLFGKPNPELNNKNNDNKPGTGHKMPKIVMPKD